MDNTLNNTSNKFIGKERDTETGYDYFGARYYDSRVSVWLSPDPLFEKHLQWCPYNYVLRNPFVLIDPDGRQIDVKDYLQNAPNAKADIQNIITEFQFFTGYKFELNENNNIIEMKEEISGQKYSKTARERVNLYFQKIHYMHYSTTGCRGEFEGDRNDIEIDPVQIKEFIDGGNKLPRYTQSWGLTLFHELEHNETRKGDPNIYQFGIIGKNEDTINDIRDEMGFPKRLSYISRNGFISFDALSKSDLDKWETPSIISSYIKINFDKK